MCFLILSQKEPGFGWKKKCNLWKLLTHFFLNLIYFVMWYFLKFLRFNYLKSLLKYFFNIRKGERIKDFFFGHQFLTF